MIGAGTAPGRAEEGGAVFLGVMLVLAIAIGGLAALGVAAFRPVARAGGPVSLVVLALIAGAVLALWASGV